MNSPLESDPEERPRDSSPLPRTYHYYHPPRIVRPALRPTYYIYPTPSIAQRLPVFLYTVNFAIVICLYIATLIHFFVYLYRLL